MNQQQISDQFFGKFGRKMETEAAPCRRADKNEKLQVPLSVHVAGVEARLENGLIYSSLIRFLISNIPGIVWEIWYLLHFNKKKHCTKEGIKQREGIDPI